MRKPFLVLIIMMAMGAILSMNAQDTSYTFGDVQVGTTDSIWIKVKTETEGSFKLISFFSAFTTEPDVYTSTDDSIKLYFSPTQNIRYNGEIIVRHTTYGANDVIEVIDVKGNGRLNDSYYSSTFNLRDENLKSELHDIIDGHNSLGYSSARDEMYMDIDNQKVNGQGAAVNTLEGVYTGNFAVGYSDRQDAQSNYNFNTEHTFPQGTFNKDEPMRSDIHHLYPTKVYANSERGNKPFGIVSNPTWQEGGSRSNSSTFEPRDVQKGPTARAMLYFLIRYQNYQNYVSSQDQEVLLNWARTFEPTEIEERRNEDIYQVQNNRNPFVDHPLFLERINNFIGTSTTPSVRSYAYSSTDLEVGDPPFTNSNNYRFAIINTGNVDLNISSVTTDGDFLIDSFSTEVSPGEDGNIYVSLGNQGNNFGQFFIEFGNGAIDTIDFGAFIYDGIEEKETVELKVYPNPATQFILLKSNLEKGAEFRIYGLDGSIKDFGTIQAGQNKIDVSLLTAGFYLLWIQHDQKHLSGKFMITE